MTIVALITRSLLDLIDLVSGSNMFLNFLPQPPRGPGAAGGFSGRLLSTHYVYAGGAVMVVSAIVLLANRLVGLALVLLALVLVNILLFDILMMPSTIGLGPVCNAAVAAGGLTRAAGVSKRLFEARFEG